VFVQAFAVVDELVGPVRCDEIGILEKLEERVALPIRIGKALVAGFRPGAIVFAGHALDRLAPHVEIAGEQRGLCLERALGIGQPVLPDL
jgi:hypothetical protein